MAPGVVYLMGSPKTHIYQWYLPLFPGISNGAVELSNQSFRLHRAIGSGPNESIPHHTTPPRDRRTPGAVLKRTEAR